MREVRTCDFCGDDATGLYEPIPPSIPDAPRLLLCDSCRDQLGSIVDPLVARIEADVSTPESGFGAEGPPAREGSAPAGGFDDASTVRDPDDRTATSEEVPGRRAADSNQIEPSSTRIADPDRDVESTAADAPPEGAEVSESRDASGRPQRERAGTPHGYRKVMRFLENRELPIERVDAERLVGEAYDLETADVAKAIDHAVQYGRLREVDGELKR